MSIEYIYTPNIEISKEIAECSKVRFIANTPEDLIGKVDLVIIATDEAEYHRAQATMFLERGMKVFIDKPLCKSIEDLEFFKTYLISGQLMSCSGFRYHPFIEKNKFNSEFNSSELLTIGYTKFDWYKYGIHLLEPIFLIHGSGIKTFKAFENTYLQDLVKIEFENGSSSILIRDQRTSGFKLNLNYKDSIEDIHFNDNFTYFRRLLEE